MQLRWIMRCEKFETRGQSLGPRIIPFAFAYTTVSVRDARTCTHANSISSDMWYIRYTAVRPASHTSKSCCILYRYSSFVSCKAKFGNTNCMFRTCIYHRRAQNFLAECAKPIMIIRCLKGWYFKIHILSIRFFDFSTVFN